MTKEKIKDAEIHYAESNNMGDKTKVDPKDKHIEELTNLLKIIQADFENYKKRIEKEKKEFVKCACEDMIKELFTVLDTFDLVIQNNPHKDIEMVYAQLWQILESRGLKKIEALNKPFDPYFHEALLQEESDKPENTVIEELQAGYMLGEKILRHTKVKVAKDKTQ